ACQPAEPSLKMKISKMEAELDEDVSLDTAKAWAITRAYKQYVKENPQDSISPYYLSKAADIYKEIPHAGLKAVNTYNKLYVEYPQHPLAPRSVFMIGFVFDEKYQDRDRAIRSYNFFLEEYPNHDLSDDARNLLVLLQDTITTDLDQIKRWSEKADSTKLKSQE
ncbi:MAG: tetratricopeptide repeat protein, partial [Owenweeksia sp.]